jgi:hypothetical protein
VNRRNLKIINLSTHYKLGLALELKLSPKERVKNKSKANEAGDTMIYFIEVRFLQTYSLLRWSQRPGLFQPFPSLKMSLSHKPLSLWNDIGTWRGFDLLFCVLE